MEFLAGIFVGQPFTIAAISIILLTGYLAQRSRRREHTSPWLLRASAVWAAYAIWEWLVLLFTPDADIRVDLLVIWPVLAVVTLWALFPAAK